MKRTKQYQFVTLCRADVDGLTHGVTIYHKRYRNADGTPMRARVTGMLKLWKTRPNDFRLPIKHGLYDSGYLTHDNISEWAGSYTEVL